MCKRPEFQVDFEWAGEDELSKKRQKLEVKSKGEVNTFKNQEEEKVPMVADIEGDPIVEQELVLS